MTQPALRVLITGANGFIGRNLSVRLGELDEFAVTPFIRGDDAAALPALVERADAVVHLAGENRPADESAFTEVNTGLTIKLCDAIRGVNRSTGRAIPLILASSAQAECDNPYGRSKLAAEQTVRALGDETGNPARIYRLPGVFGKWCRPDYNSVVATFCHNIARDLPVRVDIPDAQIRLVYIDDVVAEFVEALRTPPAGIMIGKVQPESAITVGELAEKIATFHNGRADLHTEEVGSGLTRALYATYVSALPSSRFSYAIPAHRDARGSFVEMLKTPDCGQFSFLTAPPGVTRGGHYHHTKTEKFLVIRGEALFRYRNLLTGEQVQLRTSGNHPEVVETIPGWSHDITNIGDEEMIVMLWANEVFDRNRPDTISSKVM
ncbi:MAG TPA: NAD-dependent epimerase/dehydratase family protein [Croceibacterium sp.]|nr:NAD-dependent epimerase/dehydratase family protein [Croceibacterium sp.]